MSAELHYIFATKNNKTSCLAFTEEHNISIMDWLVDNNYQIRAASVEHWNRAIDERGNKVEVYLIDEEIDEFGGIEE